VRDFDFVRLYAGAMLTLSVLMLCIFSLGYFFGADMSSVKVTLGEAIKYRAGDTAMILVLSGRIFGWW
jgi:hypothetical protein